MLSLILTLLGGYLSIIVLDFIWLGYVVKNFIIKEFHDLIVLNSD